MHSKLQELTEKIYEEGIIKSKEEGEKIVDSAKLEADEIVKNAQREAGNIVEQAEKRAKEIRNSLLSEVKLATQQAVSAIKHKIANLITSKLIETPVEKSFEDVDFVKSIIKVAIEKWNPHDLENADLSIILPEKQKKEFEEYFLDKGRKLIEAGLEVHFHEGISGGFRIGPKNGVYMVSFTEEDFRNFLKDYLKPKTINTLYGEH